MKIAPLTSTELAEIQQAILRAKQTGDSDPIVQVLERLFAIVEEIRRLGREEDPREAMIDIGRLFDLDFSF